MGWGGNGLDRDFGIAAGIIGLEKELASLGGAPISSRGGMVHLILTLCRNFEEAFAKAVDGGKGGGEQILRVFEERLTQNIKALQVDPWHDCRTG